jgi:hypothetical protein
MKPVSPKVFISHASPDGEFAKNLNANLKLVGIDSHLDQVDLKIGDNIIKWMNSEISEADYMIVLVSSNSINRYWVEIEWSNALFKEADLRRAFVIPAILPGTQDSDIPFLLRAKQYVDFRIDVEKALFQLINRFKEDIQIARDLGKNPCPAPMSSQDTILNQINETDELIQIIILSNRFSRSFRFVVPNSATPNYLLNLLRNTFNLKWNNIDQDLLVELSYTYSLCFQDKQLTLDKTLKELNIPNGSRLELWIQVSLRDLIKDIDLTKGKIPLEGTMKFDKFLHSKKSIEIPNIKFDTQSNDLMELLLKFKNRDFTSAEISQVAKKFFLHVDE